MIERCRAMAFAPLLLPAAVAGSPAVASSLAAAKLPPLRSALSEEEAEEGGGWGDVDDFGWLRASQSPNWRLLPRAEWREAPCLG